MNKNKVSKDILNKVSILSNNSLQEVFVCCNNFSIIKDFFIKYKISFTPYRFANCFKAQLDFDDIEYLSEMNEIDFIELNVNVSNFSVEKDFLHIENLTENKYFGQGQTICFIDTGIHPHLDFIFPKSRIIKFIDLTNKKTTPYDDNGHGTFVAGICSGNGIFNKQHSGFAPLSNIIVIKALNEKGNSNSNIILDAMEWIYQNHKIYNISVVCMSFGADIENGINPMSNGAEALWKCGITVVSAAGNSGPNENTIKSPGNNPYIITVGALDLNSMQVAEFSSRGPTIYGHKPDLIAPAVNLTSCNNQNHPYTQMSGTSVATPIVAGICAILKSRHPDITNNEIKKFLISHCKPITHNPDIEGAC